MRAAAAILLALGMAVGCNGSGIEADVPTGTLAGRITVGPNCPVEIEGQECPPPPGTYDSIVVLVYARRASGTRLVSQVRADDGGRFELPLPPGAYRVALEHSIGIPGGPRPVQDVRVESGATTEVAFDVDTGIR